MAHAAPATVCPKDRIAHHEGPRGSVACGTRAAAAPSPLGHQREHRWLLYIASDAQGHNAAALWIADHRWSAHLAASGLLATECLFFLVLLEPRLRWLFVPAAVALHAGTWVTLRLDYSAQLLTVVVVLVTWPAVVARLAGWRGDHTVRGQDTTGDVPLSPG